MKYYKGLQVKIDPNQIHMSGWVVYECIQSYPDAIFTIESIREGKEWGYGFWKKSIYYTIVTKPKSEGETYRFEVKEHNLISIQELRDRKINEIIR